MFKTRAGVKHERMLTNNVEASSFVRKCIICAKVRVERRKDSGSCQKGEDMMRETRSVIPLVEIS